MVPTAEQEQGQLLSLQKGLGGKGHPMKLQGIPDCFWIVTVPTPYSSIGDICVRSDFRQFALRVKGGLDENTICGVYADEAIARAEAKRLLDPIR